MKIKILWPQWSGYMDAGARSLTTDFQCDVTIVTMAPDSVSPYNGTQFFNYPATVVVLDENDPAQLKKIEDIPADVTLICGWHLKTYRKLARRLAGRTVRALSTDAQWTGKLRQWIGAVIAPFYIKPCYDYAFVPGGRQARFARKLGFAPDHIRLGHLACDFQRFAPFYEKRKERPLSKAFIFVGRLVDDKGIAILADAWQQFRARGDRGWRLKIVGTGPLAPLVENRPGIDNLGFVQPENMAECLLEGDVFVLSSIIEPWGVALQEAAATGMPIVCTHACGAADTFVRQGKNGIIMMPGDAAALADAFETIARMDEDDIRGMGALSFDLAGQSTPQSFARAVISMASASGLKGSPLF